jgi:hypothetical protein
MTRAKSGRFDQPGRALRAMRKFCPAVAVLIVAAITTSLAAGRGFQGREDGDRDDEHEGRGEYAIGLWGDLPYSDLQATHPRRPRAAMPCTSRPSNSSIR